jgi:hypothetical protein
MNQYGHFAHAPLTSQGTYQELGAPPHPGLAHALALLSQPPAPVERLPPTPPSSETQTQPAGDDESGGGAARGTQAGKEEEGMNSPETSAVELAVEEGSTTPTPTATPERDPTPPRWGEIHLGRLVPAPGEAAWKSTTRSILLLGLHILAAWARIVWRYLGPAAGFLGRCVLALIHYLRRLPAACRPFADPEMEDDFQAWMCEATVNDHCAGESGAAAV